MAIDLKELRRQSRIAAALTAFASILVLGSLFVSYNQTVQAKRELQNLQVQVSNAKSELSTLQEESSTLKKENGELEENIKGKLRALNDLYQDPRAASVLNQAALANPAIANAIPRIFLHSNGNPNKDLMEKVATSLRLKGFVVPAPDDVSINGNPTALQIVTNHAVDESDMSLIEQALAANGISNVPTISPFPPGIRHPPRTYAVYLPRKDQVSAM